MSTILIIDDDTQTRDMVSLMLQRENHAMLQAENGKQGIAMALEQEPDVILLDLMMPEVSGIDVLKALREDPRTFYTPIVVLSARNQTIDRNTCLNLGANDFLSKPITMSDLRQSVRDALEESSGDQAEQRTEATQTVEIQIDQIGTGDLPEIDIILPIISLLGYQSDKGATTLALNMGMMLRRTKKNVCLVDMNPKFGKLSMMLGIMEDRTWEDLSSLSAAPTEDQLKNVLTHHRASGIYILAAPVSASGNLPNLSATYDILKKLCTYFDHVIVDASQLDARTLLCLLASQSVVVLAGNYEESVKETRKILPKLVDHGISIDRLQVAMSHIRESSQMDEGAATQIIGHPIQHIIPFDRGHEIAHNRSIPLSVLQPRGDYARAVYNVLKSTID